MRISTALKSAACIFLGSLTASALSAPLDFVDQGFIFPISGGHFGVDVNPDGVQKILSEELPDGSRHTRFKMTPGFGEVKLDNGHQEFVFSDYSYEGFVNTYLTSTAASYLTFDWGVVTSCHGSCVAKDFHVRLDHPGSALFKEDFPLDFRFEYASGQASITRSEYWLYDPSNAVVSTRHFTILVPEPQPMLLSLGGILMVGLLASRGRHQRA